MKGKVITLTITHMALAATLMTLPAQDVVARSTPKSAQAWWPTSLDLTPLRQNAQTADPLGASFDYASAFATLDLEALKADVNETLTQSQDWWPADYGNYGPFFVPIGLAMAVAVRMVANSALSHSIVGQIMAISIKRDAFYGR